MDQQFHAALINGNFGINYKFHKKYGNLLADPVAATFAAIRAGAKDRTDFANKLAKSEREPEVQINDGGFMPFPPANCLEKLKCRRMIFSHLLEHFLL